jgi:hypothetical protein
VLVEPTPQAEQLAKRQVWVIPAQASRDRQHLRFVRCAAFNLEPWSSHSEPYLLGNGPEGRFDLFRRCVRVIRHPTGL